MPKFVLEEGAALSWNRIFFRDFIPPAPQGPAGAVRRAALMAKAPAGAARPALDWQSPNPFVVSTGGGASYNLIVWHVQPTMQWVFDMPGTYW